MPWYNELGFAETKHGINSILELEFMVNSNCGIGIDYLRKNWFGIEKFGIEVSYKKNPQINLPFLQR